MHALKILHSSPCPFAGKREQKDLTEEPGKDVLTAVWLDVVEAALGSEKIVDVRTLAILSLWHKAAILLEQIHAEL